MALELAQVEQLGSRKKANIDRTISIELARVTEAAARVKADALPAGCDLLSLSIGAGAAS